MARTCYVVPVDEFYVTPKFVLFHTKATRGIAITQLVLGCLVFLFDLVASIVGSVNLYTVSYYTGVYSGIIFILAGAFGMVAANKKSQCYLVTSMVFSIISCGFVITCLTILSIQIANNDNLSYYDVHRRNYVYIKNPVIIAFSSLALIASLVEGVTAIVQSSYACFDCCPCCKRGQFESRCRSGKARRLPLVNVQGVPAPAQLPMLILPQQQQLLQSSNNLGPASPYYSGNQINLDPTVSFMNNNNMGTPVYPAYPMLQPRQQN